MKKLLCLALSIIMMLSCLSLMAVAADESITVNVRIEGNSSCLFYDDVTLTGDTFTAYAAIEAAADSDDEVTIIYTGGEGYYYVSAVNDFYAANFSGWDGWNYAHNGIVPSVGICDETIADGDTIVLFYCDYPAMIPYVEEDEALDGEFTVYYDEAIYDSNWDITGYTQYVLTDYTLYWGYGDNQVAEIYVDETGAISIASEYLEDGAHSLQISKYTLSEEYDHEGEKLATAVLRFAPDYTVQTQEESTSFFDTIIASIKAFFDNIFSFFLNLFN
ncbi:MAG: DUF4430 domain-containing protein [Clostridia bacterium]